MQRSLTHQKSLAAFFYVALYLIYVSISSIHLFLPPLFAVLFVLFSRALKREDTFALILLSFCLMVFEAEKGYLLFSTIVYFVLLHKLVMPRIAKNFHCSWCINFASVILTYLGYYIFIVIFAKLFLIPMPDISFFVLYYMILEFLIVSIL